MQPKSCKTKVKSHTQRVRKRVKLKLKNYVMVTSHLSKIHKTNNGSNDGKDGSSGNHGGGCGVDLDGDKDCSDCCVIGAVARMVMPTAFMASDFVIMQQNDQEP